MADNHTNETRHLNMSHIRGKYTKPEEIVCKYLFSRGLRYRKMWHLYWKTRYCVKKFKTVIFVNGCFWHHHNCKRFKWPAFNVEYWIPKIESNTQKIIENKKGLRNWDGVF